MTKKSYYDKVELKAITLIYLTSDIVNLLEFMLNIGHIIVLSSCFRPASSRVSANYSALSDKKIPHKAEPTGKR